MGSIQRLSKGKYKLTVSQGFDDNGKRARKYLTVEAESKREAGELLKQFERELEKTENVSLANIRFTEYVDYWRTKYADSQLEPSTREIYEIMLSSIEKAFRRKKLSDIDALQLIDYLNSEKVKGHGSLEKKYNVLKSLFKHAAKWKLIAHDPMEGVSKPRIPVQEMKFYDRNEMELLMKLIEELDDRHQLMIKLTLSGGLRRGELLGIAWDCVDFQKSQIFIKRSLQYTKKEGFRLKETKTGDSRIIAFPSTVMEQLRIYYKKQLLERTNHSTNWIGMEDTRERPVHLFVCDELGQPYKPEAVTRFWGRFMKRHASQIKRIRFHDLRHSSASLILSEGINNKVLQMRLGHKRITTTLNTYAHVTERDDRKASDVFNDLV